MAGVPDLIKIIILKLYLLLNIALINFINTINTNFNNKKERFNLSFEIIFVQQTKQLQLQNQ